MITSRRTGMTLYTSAMDPYSHQVRIVLHEKGVTCDVVEIDLENRPEDLLEINPYGSVPTLIDRDLVLYGRAQIINEYLDERFPHPPLLPVYPVARGRYRLMMYRVERDWYSLMHKIQAGENVAANRTSLVESIMSVAPIFSEMPYFMSEEFSLVDSAVAPLLWRLPLLGVELPTDSKPLLAYRDRLFKRESFKNSLTDQEKAIQNAA